MINRIYEIDKYNALSFNKKAMISVMKLKTIHSNLYDVLKCKKNEDRNDNYLSSFLLYY